MSEKEVLDLNELDEISGGRDRAANDAGYSEPVNKYQLVVGENYYFVFYEGLIEGKVIGGDTKYLYGTCLWTGEEHNMFTPPEKNRTIRTHKVKCIMGYFSTSRTKQLYINGDKCTVYKKGPAKL